MERIPSPFENFLEMSLLEKGEGNCKIGLAYRKEVTNYHGVYHGGAIASLADTAAVQALRTIQEGPYLTVKLAIQYKSPSQSPEIIAEAKTRQLKSKLFQSDIVVRDQEGKLIAEATVQSFLPSWQKTPPFLA
jgi:acyl-CoA thioesterase